MTQRFVKQFAKDQFSYIQSAVDVFSKNASNDKFQLNEGKCKELRINFSTKTNDNIHATKINDKEINTSKDFGSLCIKRSKMELPYQQSNQESASTFILPVTFKTIWSRH